MMETRKRLFAKGTRRSDHHYMLCSLSPTCEQHQHFILYTNNIDGKKYKKKKKIVYIILHIQKNIRKIKRIIFKFIFSCIVILYNSSSSRDGNTLK
jgi:hypothetical protein